MPPHIDSHPIRIEPVDALSDDPRQRARFVGAVEAQVASARHVFGDEHSGWNLQEVLGRRRGDGWSFVDHVALAEEDQVVGMAAVALPERDNRDLALVMVHVRPEARRHGVGTALLEAALQDPALRGRSVVQTDTEWAAGEQDDSGVFARRHGFAPAQTTVRSAMPLPADAEELAQLSDGEGIEDAAAFGVEVAWGVPPDAWLEGLADLKQRMSTDAPLGETSNEQEDWDVERLMQEYGWAAETGRSVLTVIARERSSDLMVGFTQIQVGTDDPTLGYQQDTLVAAPARGHRLGLRMKAAAAADLMRSRPEVTRVRTWNAEENTHMLAVNARLGYAVEGSLRVWERRAGHSGG